MRERRAEQVRHGAGDEVLGRDPLVVPLGEREEELGLFGRHPLHGVLAEVLDDSLAVVGRHRFHGPLLPLPPKGPPSAVGESPSPPRRDSLTEQWQT